MALFKETPENEMPVEEQLPVRNNSTAAIYSADNTAGVPIPAIMSLTGTAWVNTYFNQYLGPDDALRALDLKLDATLQSYSRIKNFVIYTSDELSYSKDNVNGITTLEGSGQIYNNVVPQNGDHFIARQDDGIVSIFIITDTDKISYRAGSAWNITFKLWNAAELAYLDNFDLKTVERLVFDESKIGCDDALMNEDDVNLESENLMSVSELVSYYYDLFYDKHTETFLYPNGASRVYDPAVTSFFAKIVNRELRGNNPKATVYEIPSGQHRDRYSTIWDCMMHSYSAWKGRVSETYITRPVSSYETSMVYNNIATSFINSVIHQTSDTIFNGSIEVGLSKTYAFSKHFYEQDTALISSLEKYIDDTLNQRPPSQEELAAEVTKIFKQSKEMNFYNIPALVWLFLKV